MRIYQLSHHMHLRAPTLANVSHQTRMSPKVPSNCSRLALRRPFLGSWPSISLKATLHRHTGRHQNDHQAIDIGLSPFFFLASETDLTLSKIYPRSYILRRLPRPGASPYSNCQCIGSNSSLRLQNLSRVLNTGWFQLPRSFKLVSTLLSTEDLL